MSNPKERHYFGLNLAHQTGEGEYRGFRTSAHADSTTVPGFLDPTGEENASVPVPVLVLGPAIEVVYVVNFQPRSWM